MSLDVTELELADSNEIRMNGIITMRIWHGEAHGVHVSYRTLDLEAEFWVSPIWNMRQKGVALVDLSGQMVKHERRDR